MNNDKELIERLALEVAGEYGFETDAALIDFATRFLAAVDAERKKDDMEWRYVDSEGRQVLLNTNFFENREPLFLSQTIPEGYALVPIEPTVHMYDMVTEQDADGNLVSDGTCQRIYKAMIAAGVKP